MHFGNWILEVEVVYPSTSGMFRPISPCVCVPVLVGTFDIRELNLPRIRTVILIFHSLHLLGEHKDIFLKCRGEVETRMSSTG